MRSAFVPPRRPSDLVRYLIPSLLVAAFLFFYTSDIDFFSSRLATGSHPIDSLIRAAEKSFTDTLAKETFTLADAATAYRERRGRHPPPGFDAWHKFAAERNAIVVEDFWDQIYNDLEPFWGLKPARIRKDAWDFEMRISVRNGKATAESDWFWTQIWLHMIRTIEHLLPDMDLALNAMDEPRMVVPWEEMKDLMDLAEETRTMPDARGVISDWAKRPGLGRDVEPDEKTTDKAWEHTRPYWLIARRGCPNSSLTRHARTLRNFTRTPMIASPFSLSHMHHGFVANTTLAADFCNQPDLQALNGIFVEPLSVSATKVLFPMFGGSKLAVNNDILLPAPMYWSAEERFMGTEEDAAIRWEDKLDGVIWRGVATGGKNTAHNWRSFQRHRFVAMNNGSAVSMAEKEGRVENFVLPANGYELRAQENKQLGEWVEQWSDVRFVDLMCDTADGEKEGGCDYAERFFQVGWGMTMAEQFGYKYLPDIDGNSFSGRYLGFLRSTSLPIKATLWREWHDSRLTAWKHFVPMDNRYGDWYGIMEYFLGYEDKGGHDEIAKRIALGGREWAHRVLRREDMQIYVLRLLLEYARVSDDKREQMGWVEDLVE
ncbi:hypothetical protein QBC47DRAFT_430311 [Echria macrotheca]|uniref:Glycosyl transferase CAP10 domain-containing protein n=1 Tax=Echria macrotheca TaxID=438768 RepID=A0AAJ0BB90_9PEZI|nr:hypothetical protein QBC47DRAFT_430311 [Echria macrotheca]